MRPADLQIIGNELAIKWENGEESFFPLDQLRRRCPCAVCQGETDILGKTHKPPPTPESAASFQLVRINPVGGYAIQLFWRDGHSTGIYSFEYLRRIVAA